MLAKLKIWQMAAIFDFKMAAFLCNCFHNFGNVVENPVFDDLSNIRNDYQAIQASINIININMTNRNNISEFQNCRLSNACITAYEPHRNLVLVSIPMFAGSMNPIWLLYWIIWLKKPSWISKWLPFKCACLTYLGLWRRIDVGILASFTVQQTK